MLSVKHLWVIIAKKQAAFLLQRYLRYAQQANFIVTASIFSHRYVFQFLILNLQKGVRIASHFAADPSPSSSTVNMLLHLLYYQSVFSYFICTHFFWNYLIVSCRHYVFVNVYFLRMWFSYRTTNTAMVPITQVHTQSLPVERLRSLIANLSTPFQEPAFRCEVCLFPNLRNVHPGADMRKLGRMLFMCRRRLWSPAASKQRGKIDSQTRARSLGPCAESRSESFRTNAVGTKAL